MTLYKSVISTHTLTWSVTRGNPQSAWLRLISTHTLTWSVTLEFVWNFSFLDDFNSHAHVERDIPGKTHLQEQRYFNSHAHVERDERDWDENVLKGISTHTLTWSVTLLSNIAGSAS